MEQDIEREREEEREAIYPFQPSFSFEHYEEPIKYNLERMAKIFSSSYFFDGNSWTSLQKPLVLKKTVFDDDRILVLKKIDSRNAPIELEASLSGKYDIKVYKNKDILLCIEGEQKILMKLPITQNIITWNIPERLPLLHKSWTPIIYMLNQGNVFIRITPEKCLVISKVNDKDSFKVSCIDYSEGFCCCHPINNLALLYGSYEQQQDCNIMKLPKLPLSKGLYNYFIHFFSWGTMIVPKAIDVFKGPLCSFKKSTIALIIIPPKMHIYVELRSTSPVATSIKYKKDFLITARKPYLTDLEIYLIIQNKLIKYDYSYDLRLNKDKAPISNIHIPFKFKISKEEKEKKKSNPYYKCKWTFIDSLDQTLLTESCNSPSTHIMSQDLACIFDAETGTYYSTDYGIQHCKAFKKLRVYKK
ncbi:hypothetical protein, conserved [Plasmodium gonderi]|uniref:Uncharacterized protein n=1 Tax=Plasmodium gonderi TaxID=77519 RepID=A0A1Y1JPF4_PLAGO|nr:hypothetical protein, conserved [Plasmodium gonderi]GAW83137.1 hypothetical protein, conserved [Plasmodium gonderi]